LRAVVQSLSEGDTEREDEADEHDPQDESLALGPSASPGRAIGWAAHGA
jgi:hypothetical protein